MNIGGVYMCAFNMTEDQDAKKSPLERFCKNFSKSARDGALDPVIGRDEEIRRWPCAAAHMLNRVIKNAMKRVNNNNSVYLLPRVLRAV